jgi:hypothetical protein
VKTLGITACLNISLASFSNQFKTELDDLKVGGKSAQNLENVAQTVAKAKKYQKIYIKAQFESPKHVHQTTFEPLKYLQQTTHVKQRY